MDEKSFLEILFQYMSIENYSIEISDQNGVETITITVPENESGMVIGRKGETLRSIQRILYAVFHKSLGEKQLVVDINGYLDRRYAVVEQMALEAAEEARVFGKPITLPHLSSDERRVVHLVLAEMGDIQTQSEGIGEERRLVVYPRREGEFAVEEKKDEQSENDI